MRYRSTRMAPGSNRPWLTAVRAACESVAERAREEPFPRGAVPVGVASPSTAVPQPAQKRADAGRGSEQAGQGSVTGAC